jgi:MFS family permease
MALGILPAQTGSNVVGSQQMSYERNVVSLDGQDTRLPCNPAACHDPNDPLNFNKRAKQSIIWTAALLAGVVSLLEPMVGTSYLQVAHEFGKNLDQVTQALSGTYGLTVGLGTILTCALGTSFGKRPAFLASLLIIIGMTVWCALAKTLSSLAVARALQGFAASGIEVMASSLVVDLFLVHQRGTYFAIVGALHGTGIRIGVVAGGSVVQHLGWRHLFSGATLLLLMVAIPVFLLLWETKYLRIKPHESQAIVLREIPPKSDVADSSDISEVSTIISQRKTFLQRLAPFVSPRVSQESFWKVLVRPLPLMAFPAVLFGAFVHGLGIVYLHAFSYAKLQLFSGPPYLLTPSQIGLTALPGALVGLVGQLLGGLASDHLVKRMTRANADLCEPEFRLVLMIPQAIFSTIGFIGFGWTVACGMPLWLVLSFYASVSFSVAFGALSSMTYLMDSMPSITLVQPAIVSVLLFRSYFNLLLASKMNGWLQHYGAKRVFIALGLANLAISLGTIPFYIYGKKMRFWSTTNRKLQKLL